MRVTMTQHVGGFRDGEPWPARGETIDLPDHEGANLVRSGLAVETEPEPTSQKRSPTKKAATAEAPEA